jgi:hypothetical protein
VIVVGFARSHRAPGPPPRTGASPIFRETASCQRHLRDPRGPGRGPSGFEARSWTRSSPRPGPCSVSGDVAARQLEHAHGALSKAPVQGGEPQSWPTCVSSQATTGEIARQSLAISVLARGVASQSGQPTSREPVRLLNRSSSARG